MCRVLCMYFQHVSFCKLFTLCVLLSRTFMRCISVSAWVLETGGRSSNNLHSNSCPLGLWSKSVKFASDSLNRQPASTFLFPLMYYVLICMRRALSTMCWLYCFLFCLLGILLMVYGHRVLCIKHCGNRN